MREGRDVFSTLASAGLNLVRSHHEVKVAVACSMVYDMHGGNKNQISAARGWMTDESERDCCSESTRCPSCAHFILFLKQVVKHEPILPQSCPPP